MYPGGGEILRQKKIIGYGFMFSGLILISLLVGFYKFALHSNMEYWKKNHLLIDRVKIAEKVVALTFDDGPDPATTPAVLTSLAKHDVPATFFVVGQHAEAHPALLQKISAAGHELGNHSYSHRDFNHASGAEIRDEIRRTNQIIHQISGQQPVLFRPPGGYLSNEMIRITQEEKVIVAYWSWETDSKDWRSSNSQSIADHITGHIAPGQIIILHDGGKNGLTTARAVDLMIKVLQQKGYRFVTMGELIKMGNQE
jgi:peptidoglycan/xylan/chitin deacetylase (PgdA/CDA1 family)